MKSDEQLGDEYPEFSSKEIAGVLEESVRDSDTPRTDEALRPSTGDKVDVITLCRRLERQNAQLWKALRWYAEQAEAMHRYAEHKNTNAMMAVVTALSLDNGARAALREHP